MKAIGMTKYALALLAALAATSAGAQTQKLTMKLDFGNAVSRRLADGTANGDTAPEELQPEASYVYMVNGRTVDENTADIQVRHWNIRRIRAQRTDSAVVIRVRAAGLDKKFLKGNVGGIKWGSRFADGIDRKYISGYVLREDYDSIRRAENVPDGRLLILRDEHYRPLSPEAVYRLNGRPVDGSSLIYMEGSILQTMDIRFGRRVTRRYGPAAGNGAVLCRTYRKRLPLILLDGRRINLRKWISLCDPQLINMNTEFNYRFLSPIDGYKLYGRRARYGAIIVRSN